MGRKRSRSLFELMDPKGIYRAPEGMDPKSSEPPESPEAKSETAKAAVKKPPAQESGQEGAIEPFAAFGEGRIQLVMNYPLAVMLCFAVVIVLLCAVLIGWRLGRDSAAKNFLNAPKHQQAQPENDIDKKLSGWE